MLKFVTILTITLFSEGGKDYGVQVPFKSEEACSHAIPTAFDAFDDEFPTVVVQCTRTRGPSVSPFPQAKPMWLRSLK